LHFSAKFLFLLCSTNIDRLPSRLSVFLLLSCSRFSFEKKMPRAKGEPQIAGARRGRSTDSAHIQAPESACGGDAAPRCGTRSRPATLALVDALSATAAATHVDAAVLRPLDDVGGPASSIITVEASPAAATAQVEDAQVAVAAARVAVEDKRDAVDHADRQLRQVREGGLSPTHPDYAAPVTVLKDREAELKDCTATLRNREAELTDRAAKLAQHEAALLKLAVAPSFELPPFEFPPVDPDAALRKRGVLGRCHFEMPERTLAELKLQIRLLRDVDQYTDKRSIPCLAVAATSGAGKTTLLRYLQQTADTVCYAAPKRTNWLMRTWNKPLPDDTGARAAAAPPLRHVFVGFATFNQGHPVCFDARFDTEVRLCSDACGAFSGTPASSPNGPKTSPSTSPRRPTCCAQKSVWTKNVRRTRWRLCSWWTRSLLSGTKARSASCLPGSLRGSTTIWPADLRLRSLSLGLLSLMSAASGWSSRARLPRSLCTLSRPCRDSWRRKLSAMRPSAMLAGCSYSRTSALRAATRSRWSASRGQ
jgi:hypothetical protein